MQLHVGCSVINLCFDCTVSRISPVTEVCVLEEPSSSAFFTFSKGSLKIEGELRRIQPPSQLVQNKSCIELAAGNKPGERLPTFVALSRVNTVLYGHTQFFCSLVCLLGQFLKLVHFLMYALCVFLGPLKLLLLILKLPLAKLHGHVFNRSQCFQYFRGLYVNLDRLFVCYP